MMTMTLSANLHHFTLDSLSKRGTDRAAVEEWAESQAPRVFAGESLTDLVDRLDGMSWGELVVDLGTSYDSPTYRRLRGIVARAVRECRV